MLEIKTEDFYEDISNYPTKSKYFNDSNKLVIGKIKDETDGVVRIRIQSKDHKIRTSKIKKN